MTTEGEDDEEPTVTTETTSLNLLNLDGNVIASARNASVTGEDYYFYNKDERGNTTNIIDDTGASKINYTYDDFGETEAHGDTSFYNEICYTGGVYDDSTGLYYLNARYYDPENGRFTTQDTYYRTKVAFERIKRENLNEEITFNSSDELIEESDKKNEHAAKPQTDGFYTWKCEKKKYLRLAYGKWKSSGVSIIVKKNETAHISVNKTKKVRNIVSGVIRVSYRALNIKLGFQCDKSKKTTIKAEYVIKRPKKTSEYEIQYRQVYSLYKVVQRKYYHIDGFTVAQNERVNAYVKKWKRTTYRLKKIR